MTTSEIPQHRHGYPEGELPPLAPREKRHRKRLMGSRELMVSPELKGVPGTQGWTWKARDSSARVLVCLVPSRVTRALKAAECRFRVPLMMLLGMKQ